MFFNAEKSGRFHLFPTCLKLKTTKIQKNGSLFHRQAFKTRQLKPSARGQGQGHDLLLLNPAQSLLAASESRRLVGQVNFRLMKCSIYPKKLVTNFFLLAELRSENCETCSCCRAGICQFSLFLQNFALQIHLGVGS